MRLYARGRFRDARAERDPARVAHLLAEGVAELATMDSFHAVRDAKDEVMERKKELDNTKEKLDSLVEKPLENAIGAFEDSLVIFDDIEALVGEERKAVNELLDALLTLGRHSRTSVIVASHLPARGKETRLLLSESHRFVLMPHALGFNTLQYLCKAHVGLTVQQIQDLRSVPSRWVCLSKTFPQYQLSSGEVKLLK
jgi:hypothetical protein